MNTAPPGSQQLFRLADVRTIDQLARALGVPLQIFQDVIACEDPQQIYALHAIPKRHPRNPEDYRIAWECRQEPVARSHKAVARRLDDFARRRPISYPHAAVHGYVRGGSTRSNAQPHCGARVAIRADIENFFPTITLERIEAMLRTIGMQAAPAKALARFVTIKGALPLGLAESPVISNLVCLGLDKDLQSLAEERGVRYTRYADDITFSGDANLPSREQLRATLAKHGFRLSERKFRKSKRGQAHFVTGLSISERDYPHVPRKLKRMLRMELHFCERFGIGFHAEKINEDFRKTYLRLEGMVKYVAYIERRKSKEINDQWQRVLAVHRGPTSHAKIESRKRDDRFVIADETEFTVDGVKYLAFCCVRIANLERVEEAIQILLGDYLTKPGAKGDLDVLQAVGIHYTDAHFDLRTKTLDLMTDFLSWSASIHFARLDSSSKYKDTYLKLFADSIRQELITSDEWTLHILVERNDKVKLPSLTRVMEAEYQRAATDGARRPSSLPSVQRVEKASTSSLTLPDFVLATFRNYAQLVPDDRVLDFERIRDRVRYIHDADRGVYYTRKKPFVGIGSA
ncbi:reverse transcriptase family protein [Dyella sp. RRB7]|uniref:reverse transcriptase family protein n=1 Tax=Dyella sp. RRB7 TaxID=2919502 RepID=UPI001FA9B992|nr:reverse transcriptase family protein [Dyella sp. RRB7]